MTTSITKPSDILGSPLSRVDGESKVKGQATYSAEWPIENLAYGVLFGSTIASGRVVAIDTKAAQAVPGVVAILTHENAPRLAGISAPPAGQVLTPLQDTEVFYHGQHLGLVVAESLEAATYAAGLIGVSYTETAAKTRLDDHIDEQYDSGSLYGEQCDEIVGDAVLGMEQAEVTLDREYRTSLQHHNPMEPSATIAAWNGDRVTLYDATQWVSGVQTVIAAQFNLPTENVRVISHFLGGGFGCKGWVWPHVVITTMAAKLAGRPVKTVLTRRQMFTSHGNRSGSFQHVRLGAKHDGTLTAIVHDAVVQTSPFDERPDMVTVGTRSHYQCPNIATTNHVVKINQITPTPMRAPNEAAGHFGLECALDEFAEQLGLDPIELRLRNYAEVHPRSGKPWTSKRLRECYEVGKEKFGWHRRNPQPRSLRDGNELVGFGFASAVNFVLVQGATVRATLFADGTAQIETGSQDIGTGTYTVLTQIAAQNLGLEPGKIRVHIGDTHLPPSGGSFGSSTASSAGSAVQIACKQLVERMRDFAHPDEPLADALRRTGTATMSVEATFNPSEVDEEMNSFGAIFAEVGVDELLGTVRVRRLTGVWDAGRILNPKTARSQLIGGLIWGIGVALHERTLVDPDVGRYTNANIAEYLIPVHADIHAIEAHVLPSPGDFALNPLGTKGIGELGVVGVPSAIVNAYYSATGNRRYRVPLA